MQFKALPIWQQAVQLQSRPLTEPHLLRQVLLVSNDLSISIGIPTVTGGLVSAGTFTIGQTAVALSSLGTNAAANTLILSNADNSTYTLTGNNDLTLTLKQGGGGAADRLQG